MTDKKELIKSAEKELKEIKKEIAKATDIVSAMALLLFTTGEKAKSTDEESLAGYVLQLQKILSSIHDDESTMEQLTAGIEKMLLE